MSVIETDSNHAGESVLVPEMVVRRKQDHVGIGIVCQHAEQREQDTHSGPPRQRLDDHVPGRKEPRELRLPPLPMLTRDHDHHVVPIDEALRARDRQLQERSPAIDNAELFRYVMAAAVDRTTPQP